MDIYGYSYYNEADELAKNMFAQQALNASATYTRPETEPHAMPMPSSTPWNSRGLTWGMQCPPQLVQFTANAMRDDKFNPVVHSKRKNLDLEPAIPAKQLITEEKMAAHLNSLHISSQYTPHSVAGEDVWMDTSATAMIDSEKLKGHTIVLSEELKKIQEEPLLPAVLIERLEKPSMSLVVWKPRENILCNIAEQEEKSEELEEKELPRKRTGVLVLDEAMNDVEM